MTHAQRNVQLYLAGLSERLGIALTLNNGVCALYDNDRRQAAIIEVPDHSDNVIIHARLGLLRNSPQNLQHLLNINFDVSKLRGCWLSLDQQNVCLCTQRELSTLDEKQFCDLVTGFTEQLRQTRSQYASLLA